MLPGLIAVPYSFLVTGDFIRNILIPTSCISIFFVQAHTVKKL
jgi:hypothetical protein